MKLQLKTPQLYIETYGCQMNIADSEIVAGILLTQGYTLSSDVEHADLILINTCSVRDNAEQRVWNRLDFFKGLKRRHRGIMVGVIGCMAERIGDDLAKHEAVDIVAGPDSYRDIPMLLDKAKTEGKGINIELSEVETYSGITPERIQHDQISGFVNIMRGCNNFCTYCIVPYTRGRERSCDPKEVISEVKSFIALNYREITLLGQNVNSYKWIDGDTQTTFPQLVEMVAQVDPTVRIRFTTSHPKDISDALIEVIAKYPNVCKHIHLPVQSGSNSVLERMNRKYTREYYLERVNKIRELIPNCGLSTDIFCGFPGETEADFQDSLRLMEEVGYDLAFMFKYSERPGTYAAKHLSDDIDEKTKTERLMKIINLQNGISKKRNQTDIGKTYEVLVEGFSKKSENDLVGRTQQNKVVVFPNKGFAVGELVNVKIISSSSATLLGEAINDKN
ncbi:MAG: tRNA (N6-isopentenyl adenosine(37)-C2)-methylthiotransferase MiaB [Salinivirgaceae bacterium]|nr:tRNA (N6-isopentenyl adenosine(37)-C2)-methylthiotransferase MiaB [Salinivirgaceae bacterium]MDY0280300.1 tRNA (N6-isopentenyl adenosine(37)-C2)-methylthiotransferase MiaB [Salinivirgaceae bacterium]